MNKLEESIEQKKEMWNEIHDCIRMNDIEQLMTLLSEHNINLDIFNLSQDGDTILHSAAKSNNVKMIEFIIFSDVIVGSGEFK
jgi:ankyrin repeat protein